VGVSVGVGEGVGVGVNVENGVRVGVCVGVQVDVVTLDAPPGTESMLAEETQLRRRLRTFPRFANR
jgi:hypothetical protein